MLDAWRESSLYTDRERAALAWTEALTLVADTGAPNEDYEQAKKQFSETEVVNLAFSIGAINNRLQIASRAAHPVAARRFHDGSLFYNPKDYDNETSFVNAVCIGISLPAWHLAGDCR